MVRIPVRNDCFHISLNVTNTVHKNYRNISHCSTSHATSITQRQQAQKCTVQATCLENLPHVLLEEVIPLFDIWTFPQTDRLPASPGKLAREGVVFKVLYTGSIRRS